MKLFWAFSSFEVGGAQRRFVSLAEELGSDFTHIVTAMDGRYDAETLLGDNVSYNRCELPVCKGGFIARENVTAFSAALGHHKPALLLTTNWGSIEWRVANRGLKTPHLHCEDGFGPDEAIGVRNIKRDLARRILFSRIPTGHERYAFMAPSSGLAKIFQQGWGIPQKRIHLIPNGIDIARFASATSTSGNDGIPVIGSVGAFRAEKRFDRLIRVFAALRKERKVQLLLVGDGPERASLEALVNELGIKSDVTFAGAMRDVRGPLAQMDIYAITSDTEQMPISLVEAMAAGRPVVGADVGDVKLMLDPSNADFVHSAEDEASMVKSLLALLENKERAAMVGAANAQKAAKEYSVDMMVQRYRKLFEKLTR